MSGTLSTAPGRGGAPGTGAAAPGRAAPPSLRLGLGEGDGEGVEARSNGPREEEVAAGRRPAARGRKQSILGFSESAFTLVTTTGLSDTEQRQRKRDARQWEDMAPAKATLSWAENNEIQTTLNIPFHLSLCPCKANPTTCHVLTARGAVRASANEAPLGER